MDYLTYMYTNVMCIKITVKLDEFGKLIKEKDTQKYK